VTWTRNAGDDTGVTDASELTRCRRIPSGDVGGGGGGGFRFSWTVAVPRARNNRAAVAVTPSRAVAAARRCIDIGNGGRTVTRVFTTTSGKTRAIIGRDCAYRGNGPVIVAGEEIFFVYIELPRQLTHLVIVCTWVGVLCDVV